MEVVICKVSLSRDIYETSFCISQLSKKKKNTARGWHNSKSVFHAYINNRFHSHDAHSDFQKQTTMKNYNLLHLFLSIVLVFSLVSVTMYLVANDLREEGFIVVYSFEGLIPSSWESHNVQKTDWSHHI